MIKNLVDICVNLTDEVFSGNEQYIIDEANQQNVTKMIFVGNDLKSSEKCQRLAQKYNFFSTAGYHPHNAKEWHEDSYKELQKLIKFENVRAVGECGLDFNRNFSSPEIQHEVFAKHIDLANETGLPLFVHERDAFHQMHKILSENVKDCKRVLVHCFTGTKNALEDYLTLGIYIGLTGWICDDRRGKHLLSLIHI